MCNSNAPNAAQPVALGKGNARQVKIIVSELSDHLLYFFAGREGAGERAYDGWNWYDDAAMKLGVGVYAIHRGDRAVLYDTFVSVAHARWVRDYLENRGIRHISVVLSHWHLDHVAGNSVFQDCPIIATRRTRTTLATDCEKIQTGTLWGLPEISPLVLPNVVFDERLTLIVGDISLELQNINIHSADTTVVYLPASNTLLAGDALEDSLTFMVEVDQLPEHVKNLRQLRRMTLDRIYPNHGDPDTIRAGGYNKTLVDAAIDYIDRMLTQCHEPGFVTRTMEEMIGDSVEKGWVHAYEPYRDVHAQNVKLVDEYYRSKLTNN